MMLLLFPHGLSVRQVERAESEQVESEQAEAKQMLNKQTE